MLYAQNQLRDNSEDLTRNFESLLEHFDYDSALKILEVSFFSFQLKKDLRSELEALYTALWHLALKQSFPNDHSEFFNYYLDTAFLEKYPSSVQDKQKIKVLQYIEALGDNPHADMSPISLHILSFCDFDAQKQKSISLKIALHTRQIYNYIFERLM